MELGEKIRRLRLEAGLSQRQLCGERITRNMLSQIEHGAARPSMETLRYLASRLEKPVSWFLDEEAVTSPNQDCLARARDAWELGDGDGISRALKDYRGPDGLFDREAELLGRLGLLLRAEAALTEGRTPYGAALLGVEPWKGGYCAGELEGKRLALLARAGEAAELPSLDEELKLRARIEKQPERAARLLDAARDREDPEWNLLRGRCHMAAEEWAPAASCLHRAELLFPEETAPLLEECYHRLEDYKRAYEYARRQRREKPQGRR